MEKNQKKQLSPRKFWKIASSQPITSAFLVDLDKSYIRFRLVQLEEVKTKCQLESDEPKSPLDKPLYWVFCSLISMGFVYLSQISHGGHFSRVITLAICAFCLWQVWEEVDNLWEKQAIVKFYRSAYYANNYKILKAFVQE